MNSKKKNPFIAYENIKKDEWSHWLKLEKEKKKNWKCILNKIIIKFLSKLTHSQCWFICGVKWWLPSFRFLQMFVEFQSQHNEVKLFFINEDSARPFCRENEIIGKTKTISSRI